MQTNTSHSPVLVNSADVRSELFVDNFAGGGGTSTGIFLATGRQVDIAVNHDDNAIAMHRTNHPESFHYCESVWDVKPREAVNGRPVALCWCSPDCKHHSIASGGRPKDKNIRGLMWVMVRWAATVKPRVLMAENVPEILSWGPLDESGKPVKERKGETFSSFIRALERQGYTVEHRILHACDYGAPTIRKRWFLIARCDDNPIVWPDATHGPKDSAQVEQGQLAPYRSSGECIDWSVESPSIFERKRPLVPNSCKRLVRGLERFTFNTDTPYLVNSDKNTSSVAEPNTQLRAHVLKYYGTNIGFSAHTPLHTITSKDRFAAVKSLFKADLTDDERYQAWWCARFIEEHSDHTEHSVVPGPRPHAVTIDGRALVDVGLRMLTARELFNGQGFPEDYIIDRDCDGNRYTHAQQVARCGNAVPPQFAKALIEANLPEHCPGIESTLVPEASNNKQMAG